VTKQEKVVQLILDERVRQDEKWGTDRSGGFYTRWLTILVEEVGEVAEAILEAPHYPGLGDKDVRAELVQVAAVAMAALEFGGQI